MAKPIPLVLKPPEISTQADVREDLRRKLAEAPIEHAAALLSMYELIETAHDSGTLDLLRGLLGARDDIVGQISAALKSPEAVRSIRNTIALAQIIGSIDSQLIDDLRDALTESVAKNRNAASGKPPGLWSIMKRADSENSLRVLAIVTDFLDNFGRRMKHSQQNSDGAAKS